MKVFVDISAFKTSMMLFILILLILNNAAEIHAVNNHKLASHAISSMIDQLIFRYQLNIHLVSYANDQYSRKLSNQISKLSEFPISHMEVEHLKEFSELSYQFGKSQIIISRKDFFTESFKYFTNFERRWPDVPDLPEGLNRYSLGDTQMIRISYAYDDNNKDSVDICSSHAFSKHQMPSNVSNCALSRFRRLGTFQLCDASRRAMWREMDFG